MVLTFLLDIASCSRDSEEIQNMVTLISTFTRLPFKQLWEAFN